MSKIKPMLAYSDPVAPEDLNPEDGPWWVSPKLDGIRSINHERKALTRTLKLVPNRYIQALLASDLLHGLDGELIVGDPTHPNVYNRTVSVVMSMDGKLAQTDGKPNFALYVFDLFDKPKVGYATRKREVAKRARDLAERGFPVVLVEQVLCRSIEEVREAVDNNYAMGYEGSIFRAVNSPYKYNRSTRKEGYLLKCKESVDSEIQITSFEEMMHNDNTLGTDERGYAKRSSHKANKRPAGTLGKIHGIDIHSKQPITIGTGKMTAEEKLEVWLNQDKYLSELAKYRFAKHGIKDKPRHPRWIGWRSKLDV